FLLLRDILVDRPPLVQREIGQAVQIFLSGNDGAGQIAYQDGSKHTDCAIEVYTDVGIVLNEKHCRNTRDQTNDDSAGIGLACKYTQYKNTGQCATEYSEHLLKQVEDKLDLQCSNQHGTPDPEKADNNRRNPCIVQVLPVRRILLKKRVYIRNIGGRNTVHAAAQGRLTGSENASNDESCNTCWKFLHHKIRKDFTDILGRNFSRVGQVIDIEHRTHSEKN